MERWSVDRQWEKEQQCWQNKWEMYRECRRGQGWQHQGLMSYLTLTHTSTHRCKTWEDVTYLIAAGAQTHTYRGALGRHQGMMGRGFFIPDWAVPTHSPKDTQSSSGWCFYFLTRLLSACGDNIQSPTRCTSYTYKWSLSDKWARMLP